MELPTRQRLHRSDAEYVLIIAPPADTHALSVVTRIEQRGFKAVIWDSARLPARDRLSFYVCENRAKAVLDSSALGEVHLDSLTSVWWRRPLPATIPGDVAEDFSRAYCRNESEQLFCGIISGLGVPIFNNPDAEAVAGKKALQLKVAREVGLQVPPTLISSSPERVREFVLTAPPGGVVFKPFRAPIGSACATQALDRDYIDGLHLLHNAPVIFQYLIPPYIDVRVSVVGGQMFAGESRSAKLDWRTDSRIEWKYHKLPKDVEGKIILFMDRLGLDLGHLDFRLSPAGEYWFFEVNPCGQFLFLEVDDERLEISGAVADLLMSGSASGRR